LARITASAPVLLTRDLLAACDYYRDKLGFTYELFNHPPSFAILRRDDHSLMLAQAGRGAKLTPNWKIVDKTWNVYFWTDNADALYKEFQQSGAIIDYTIYDTPWGTREFGVQDLDDHDIAFGQILSK
jgi:uncharacterized glyoxalase superfamily protein PhnB